MYIKREINKIDYCEKIMYYYAINWPIENGSSNTKHPTLFILIYSAAIRQRADTEFFLESF